LSPLLHKERARVRLSTLGATIAIGLILIGLLGNFLAKKLNRKLVEIMLFWLIATASLTLITQGVIFIYYFVFIFE